MSSEGPKLLSENTLHLIFDYFWQPDANTELIKKFCLIEKLSPCQPISLPDYFMNSVAEMSSKHKIAAFL